MTQPSGSDEWDETKDTARPAFPPGPGGLRAVPAGRSADELMDLLAARQGRLATLPVIEQAKGALMMTYGLTDDAAFAVLRAHSQNRNVKLRELAAELIGNAPHCLLGARAHGDLDRLLDSVTDDLRRPTGPDQNPAPPSEAPGTDDAGPGRE